MENKIKIITPEGVQLFYEIAGIGSRFVALLLDMLIQITISLIILSSLIGVNVSLGDDFSNMISVYTALLIIVGFTIFVGYFIFFEMILKGRSPGKAALKLRVIKSNGQPISFIASVLRNIFRFVDAFPGLYAVGIIVMFISNESRRLGDYVAGTIVVKEYASRIPISADFTEKEKTVVVNIYPLSSEEYHLLKEYLNRRAQLAIKKRNELSQQLSKRFYDKFNIPFEERKDDEKFLEVLVEMNH
ncbi:MAG: RDD family protein [Clostridia bacterium]